MGTEYGFSKHLDLQWNTEPLDLFTKRPDQSDHIFEEDCSSGHMWHRASYRNEARACGEVGCNVRRSRNPRPVRARGIGRETQHSRWVSGWDQMCAALPGASGSSLSTFSLLPQFFGTLMTASFIWALIIMWLSCYCTSHRFSLFIMSPLL